MHNHLGWYGIAVGSLLAIKLLASMKRRRPAAADEQRTPNLTVAAIITVFNEHPAMLRRCLESLLDQTRRPDTVTVIDDCSADRSASGVIDSIGWRFREAGIRLDFIRFPVNRGKRHGLAAGFSAQPDADVYLAVDSDTIAAPDAVEQLLKPFARRRVHCTTALVMANNRATNLLTRLIDMRYVNAFLGERVAYSRLGSVLCACGSMAMYRGWVMRKYLDNFLGQRFLGKPATFGDDRRLTYYCLLEGQSLIVPAAIAWTDVPDTTGGYLKQQLRWSKSFIRESVLMAFTGRVPRAYWWLNLIELATWIAFTSALVVAMAVFATHPHAWTIVASYAVYVSAAAWLRSVHYLRKAGDVPTWDRYGTFLAAPLYALMNLGLLIPLRFYAIATLRKNGWGTRQKGVEIQRPVIPQQAPTLPVPRPEAVTVPLKLLDPLTDATLEMRLDGRGAA